MSKTYIALPTDNWTNLGFPAGHVQTDQHLTLAFLGHQELSDECVQEVWELAKASHPFIFQMDDFAMFGPRNNVVVHRIKFQDRLFIFREAIMQALNNFGFDVSTKYKFKPHITLWHNYVPPKWPIAPDLRYAGYLNIYHTARTTQTFRLGPEDDD